MNDLEPESGFHAEVIPAALREEADEKKQASAINYGRVAIEMMEALEKVPAQTSPSLTAPADADLDRAKLSTKDYGAEVDLALIKMEAADLGTLIHHCYHALLVDLTLSDRLFASLNGKLPHDVFMQIQKQVIAFKNYSECDLESVKVQCEVPVLSKTEQGSTVSGSIDLLVETDKGYWIIDHKSDGVNDFEEQFTHHYPQLEAYAEFTNLDKPLLGVGINWVRYGKVSLLWS